MVSPEIGFRRIDARASDAILELVGLGLGESTVPRSRAFWNWKHVHNPFGESYCLAAEADGQLVGLRVFMKWSFRSGGRSVPVVRAVDTVTHPEWQGRGIFSSLTRKLLALVENNGVRFVYNTPNHRSRPGYLKMGWRIVARIPVFLRLLRPFGLMRGLLVGGRRREAGEQTFELPPVEELLSSEDSELLFELDADDSRLHTARSREYCRWRYQEVPGLRYHAVWERSGDRMAAVLLRARWRRSYREVSVAELLLGRQPGSVDLASELLDSIAGAMSADYLVASAPPGTPERLALRGSRFVSLPGTGPYFTVRQIGSPLLPPPESWPSWRLSLGDLELF